MAEEMLEKIASETKSENRRSNRKTSGSALNNTSSDALGGTVTEPHVAAKPHKARSLSKPGRKRTGAKVPRELSSEVKEFVGKHLKAILNGVLKGVKLGNATGAKLLFDYYNAADAEPGEKGLGAAEETSLADLFGPDFDWKSLQISDNTNVAETPLAVIEAGIDVGADVEIASRESE